ncbi:MAG TPA: C4-type zinc ribbon domain-containing protein [Planctomycetota bacterium]|nr:C4-type zinc ribbon domain-containing protein [Planctomycetota bacterium]
MPLHPAYPQLLAVQGLDKTMMDITRDLARFPAEIDRLAVDLNRQKAILATIEGELKTATEEADEKARELEINESGIRKRQAQMAERSTARDYQNLVNTVAVMKSSSRKLEEAALEMMGRVEERKKEVESIRAKVAIQEGEFRAVETDLKAKIAVLEQRKAALDAEHAVKIKGIPADLLDTYRRLIKANTFPPLAPVEEMKRCSACHTVLPPGRVNRALQGKDVICCEMCKRILYDGRDLPSHPGMSALLKAQP